jgi:hypothetical protein
MRSLISASRERSGECPSAVIIRPSSCSCSTISPVSVSRTTTSPRHEQVTNADPSATNTGAVPSPNARPRTTHSCSIEVASSIVASPLVFVATSRVPSGEMST